MNRNYVAYAYVYVYVSYKNEMLKKREDVGKRLGGYWEDSNEDVAICSEAKIFISDYYIDFARAS